MRVIDCDCGVTLQAATDDELASRVREHVESDHPDMQLDDDQAREMVGAKAYSATDS
jgi:predicted small metal-binding protein